MNITLRAPEFFPQNDVQQHRARIGFVLSAEDRTFESDIRAIELEGVTWSFSRMPPHLNTNYPLDRDPTEVLAHIQQSTAILQSAGDLDVALFAGGCLAAVLGNDRILETVRTGSGDALVSSVYTATKRAARAIQAKSVAIATGYDPKVNDLISAAFTRMGIQVVCIRGMAETSEFDFSHKSPRTIRNFALSLDRADADAIVISSTTMRGMEVVDELEQIAGKPVLCSNQVAIWDALRSAGISDRIAGYGSLLQNY